MNLGLFECHWSAISAYHRQIIDLKVGVHPKVSELMKGAFDRWSPKPKNTFMYNVQRVLELGSWSDNKKISNKEIYLKLIMLIELFMEFRAIGIHY